MTGAPLLWVLLLSIRAWAQEHHGLDGSTFAWDSAVASGECHPRDNNPILVTCALDGERVDVGGLDCAMNYVFVAGELASVQCHPRAAAQRVRQQLVRALGEPDVSGPEADVWWRPDPELWVVWRVGVLQWTDPVRLAPGMPARPAAPVSETPP